MSCPFNSNDASQEGCNRTEGGGHTYGEYLQLENILSAQRLLSQEFNNTVPDEHLFIITHQTYELWFKQILYDLDIVLALFNKPQVNEHETLKIVSKLERIVKIFKLLVEQILILETMSPLDFGEFRKYLAPASGFQSLQFRLLENKLGVLCGQRVLYNAQHYKDVFRNNADKSALERSEQDDSLLQVVNKWLERVPGLEERGFNFWAKYCCAVKRWQEDNLTDILHIENEKQREQALSEYEKTKKAFESVLQSEVHDTLQEKGDRRLSHKALQGALMIMLYRDYSRFSQPYQILSLLMDIDSLLIKWRYNHVMLVQRMMGNKQGTGGSSGYMYLRSTCSDRYKVFNDLFNLSTWLIPRSYVPSITRDMEHRLSCSLFYHHEADLKKYSLDR